jgi:hypothetical protein
VDTPLSAHSITVSYCVSGTNLTEEFGIYQNCRQNGKCGGYLFPRAENSRSWRFCAAQTMGGTGSVFKLLVSEHDEMTDILSTSFGSKLG